jgi:hypothetical protein
MRENIYPASIEKFARLRLDCVIIGLSAEQNADVAELVDALDLGSSISDVRVRVSPSALYT